MNEMTDLTKTPQQSESGDQARRNGQADTGSKVAEASAPYLAQAASNATPVSHDCPPGYKRTEVGVIPEDWEIDSIGNLLSITTGNKNTQDRVDDGIYPFFVRSQTVERINSYSFDGEGVLTAGDGVGTGKIFHYINGKFDFHQRVYLIYNFGKKIDGYYFYIYFSNKFYDRIMSMTAKSSVDSVRREMIADMKVVLPPQKEQTAIANALSDVDALISELEKLIAKKQAIKTATMQQLLTGRTRLPQFALREDGTPTNSSGTNLDAGTGGPKGEGQDGLRNGYKQSELGEIPEDWEVVTLAESTNCLDNLRVPLNERQRATMRGNIPYCGANGIVDWVNDYVLDDDVILIAEDGGYFDEYSTRPIAYRMVGKCWVNNHAHILKAQDDFDQGYIFYCLVHKDIQKYLASGTRAKLNKSEMERIEIIAPLFKTEQTAIATILSDMDAEIQALQQQLSKTRQIKQGMMQELLTGKTRLVKPKQEVA